MGKGSRKKDRVRADSDRSRANQPREWGWWKGVSGESEVPRGRKGRKEILKPPVKCRMSREDGTGPLR